MSSSSPNPVVRTVALTCHPTTPCQDVRSIEVEVRRGGDTTLEFGYRLDGDLARLLIPSESTPRRADGLWQHTCFEAFLASEGGVGYYEFNFAPSGEWAIYRFSAYREAMTAVEDARPPRISVRREAARLSLEAVIDLASLPALQDTRVLRLALSAVVEDAQLNLSYWALAHPPGKPNFHHADSFTLTLPSSLSRRRGRGR